MISEALKTFRDLIRKPESVKAVFNGIEYAVDHNCVHKAMFPSWPEPIEGNTITGLVDFVNDLSRSEAKPLIIHIKSPYRVSVFSELIKPWAARKYYYEAVANRSNFKFGMSMGSETFIINLQASFIKSDATKLLLKFVGNLKSGASHTSADDGVTQTSTARTGITQVESVKVQNPVTLAPYRTFQEVDQPESQYIFRMKQGDKDAKPKVALYECDDIRWGMEAMRSIADYLAGKLNSTEAKFNIIA